ncbi:hypothetical protein AW40_07180 [Kosakonia radicincitans UMEnt01/12]|uniref:hypothetical protein n=1 Tax=Kosakonia radicincitans TaxID=283686 RepID=UPI0004616519|nr:hypothetical protein [Kosakonia radicincitans]KDE37421.1 hypothetical protein AW40_07180 [Kosakonia radicincitans UMEnt01/12]
MAKIKPTKRSFNAGELAPVMYGQVDFDKWASAVKYMMNFIPLPQGPARRRGGTYFVGEVKNSANKVWLASFEYSTSQAFIMEIGPGYIRLFYDHGVVYDGSGNTLEIATPYTADDLTNNGKFGLSMQQSGDVIYVCCINGKYPVYKLTRITNTNWTFEKANFRGGPFQDINSDKTIVVSTNQFRPWSADGEDLPDGTPTTSSLCTITANADIFKSTHVGSLFYIESISSDANTWYSGKTVSVGYIFFSDGKFYEAMTAGTTGNVQPTWTAGAHYDGAGDSTTKVKWRYAATWGAVLITSVTDSKHAVGKILLELPASVMSSPTYAWAFGEWSEAATYPQFVAFFRGRLVFSGNRKIWSSVAGDLENFNPMTNGFEAESDDSINDRIDDTQDALQWMIPAAGKIFIGTAGFEFTYGEQSVTSPFGAGNTKVELNSSYGSNEVVAERMGNGVAFVQRAGRKVLGAMYDSATDGYSTTDQTILAPHITAPGIISMSYQQEPNRILWCALSDGSLRALTHNTEQNVIGWHRHNVGGAVECVKCIPDINGGRDEVWMVVKRTINGTTKRYIEYMTSEFDGTVMDQPNATVLDCMLTYNGAAVTEISGLNHLEGETISVVTDGATHPERIVSGGKISLEWASNVVHAGYNNAAELITLPLEGGQKRFAKARLRFLDTLGGKYGDENGQNLDALRARDYADNMDEAPPLFSGVVTVPWPGGYNENGCIRIVQDLPQPMTIVSIDPVGEMEDD